MTVRDLVIFLGDRGFFADKTQLTAMDVMLFLKFSSVVKALEEGEEDNFRKFFTLFSSEKVTFVEFVQTIAFIGMKVIPYDWEMEQKFEYTIENIDAWKPLVPPPTAQEEAPEEEEEAREAN